MRADILASGSDGNCTAIYSGDKILLLDCGKSAKWILQRLQGKLPNAVLVTHEHGDHSKAVEQFLKRGVEIFLTAGTRKALGIEHYNLHTIKAGDTFQIADCVVEVLPSIHDAAEPVNFIVADADDRLLYITDTGAAPEVTGTFTKIFIEANYSEPVLLANVELDARQRRRILMRHLSIEQAEYFVKHHHAAQVTPIHISHRHGDAAEFNRRLQIANS